MEGLKTIYKGQTVFESRVFKKMGWGARKTHDGIVSVIEWPHQNLDHQHG